MKRGDIYFANVDPARGADTKKTRPVLIISNDANNKMAATVTVIPITSNTKRVYPFEVLLKPNISGLSKTSKAQCHQIRTISKLRINKKRSGKISSSLLMQIENALNIHLQLEA